MNSHLFPHIRHVILLLVPILTLPGQAASAQDDTRATRWYNVEIIVYAHNIGWRDTEEQWRDQLALSYPDNTEVLRSPFDETAQVESFDDGINATNGPTPPNVAAQDIATDSGDIQPDKSTTPESYTLIEDDALTLTAAAKRIAAQRDLRLLTHVGWQQQMRGTDQSVPILITGGDLIGDHYELEGTLRLSVERYLHLETNLWLNTFVAGSTSNILLWNALPTRPTLAVPSNVAVEPESDSGINPFLGQTENTAPWERYAFHPPAYVAEKTVVMQQKRRMRSGELHYIDHPLMGLLIRIDPLPEPDESADATGTNAQ